MRTLLRYSLALDRPCAEPSPATHAILTDLKAGESAFQTLLLTKTVVHAYRVAQPLSHALFWRQNTVWDACLRGEVTCETGPETGCTVRVGPELTAYSGATAYSYVLDCPTPAPTPEPTAPTPEPTAEPTPVPTEDGCAWEQHTGRGEPAMGASS